MYNNHNQQRIVYLFVDYQSLALVYLGVWCFVLFLMFYSWICLMFYPCCFLCVVSRCVISKNEMLLFGSFFFLKVFEHSCWSRFFVSSSIVEPQNVFLQERRHDFLPELDCAIAKMSSHWWLWVQRVILRWTDIQPSTGTICWMDGVEVEVTVVNPSMEPEKSLLRSDFGPPNRGSWVGWGWSPRKFRQANQGKH